MGRAKGDISRTVIKGGMVVCSAGVAVKDLLVEDEKIAAIADSSDTLSLPGDKIIDATGQYVLPGGIDVLAEGSDADIILLDPTREYRITHSRLHENVDYTPYEGIDVSGEITLTMLRGKVIAREGIFTGKEGEGKFINRKKWSEL